MKRGFLFLRRKRVLIFLMQTQSDSVTESALRVGSVEVAHLKGEVTLDKWLRFAVPAQHAVMICAMREKLMVRWILHCCRQKWGSLVADFFLAQRANVNFFSFMAGWLVGWLRTEFGRRRRRRQSLF